MPIKEWRETVEARQALRRQSDLPLLQVSAELRRLWKVERSRAFNEWANADNRRNTILTELVAQYQAETGSRPNFIVGMHLENVATKRLREQFQALKSPRI